MKTKFIRRLDITNARSMHLGAPPIPHFGDHESGEDDASEDWYGQELDAGCKRCDNLPEDHVKATLQKVEGLLLEVVNVRWRTSSRRGHYFTDETGSARLRARD
jgi:hypothetical protein